MDCAPQFACIYGIQIDGIAMPLVQTVKRRPPHNSQGSLSVKVHVDVLVEKLALGQIIPDTSVSYIDVTYSCPCSSRDVQRTH
jgi:hypothetical protein